MKNVLLKQKTIQIDVNFLLRKGGDGGGLGKVAKKPNVGEIITPTDQRCPTAPLRSLSECVDARRLGCRGV